ncbi:hypothetical protein [Paracoccus sp. TOH]|uniref:hypothetical protein n=1 Tax=Paracoccus sp. TOH TaxID=1263728 RepID=UPI0025B17A97|nr:hypothetical protein [Paracoccus sp. TOH]WJS87278.1 hypothetical protein NBE95_20580 [Paracoccus sp. TOH]
MPRLTKPLLDAMASALAAALAGEGFEGGDFDGEDRSTFERAHAWVVQEQVRRENRRK